MTDLRYLDDPALDGVMTAAEILRDERPAVRTAQTWFHVQGGGQKADRGTLGPARVLDVRKGADGEVWHFVDSLDGLEAGQSYPFAIDADWRRMNAAWHSAGHLLGAVCETLFPGVEAFQGHQWPGEARVDFQGEGLERVVEGEAQLREALDAAIAADLPVTMGRDAAGTRIWLSGDYRSIPCGGTHVARTGEIGAIRLRSLKIKNAQLRIGYEIEAA